jgi:glycosyltransferase involved in cell wall biosynthesis
MAERTFQMSRFLSLRGIETKVLAIDNGFDKSLIEELRPAELVVFPEISRRFYIPRVSWSVIKSLVNSVDIIHLMGHWTLLNAVVYLAARRIGKPYVVCPAGALPIFGRSQILKRLYNAIIGDAIIKNASAWIAVTSQESFDYVSYGVNASDVTVIPNGIDVKNFPRIDIKSSGCVLNLPEAPFILFMGRLNLIKGPDLLLNAFVLAGKHISNYHLVFAGSDEGMRSELLSLAKEAGVQDRIHFIGFVDGLNKLIAYQLASLLVVPSRQEAMSIVALEAAACGTPVMLTDQCGFSQVRNIDSRLEVPATVSGLASGLLQVLKDSEHLPELGARLKEYVLQRYTWSSVVSEYLNLYKTILATYKK